MERLKTYNEKRDLTATGEPKGNENESADGIYCIQHHSSRRDHFDLRLGYGSALVSWAVPKGMPTASGERRLAVRVEDHPADYAEFEGTIPKGNYGGGTVMLWDRGSYVCRGSMKEGLERGELKIEIFGVRLKGRWALVRTDGDNWLVIKERDEKAHTYYLGDESVKTGRTMDEIARAEELVGRKNPFLSAGPMLAVADKALPEGENWAYEIKYDGYRALAFVESFSARLVSRSGKEFGRDYSRLTHALAESSLGRAFVLDGEIVALGEDGKPDFGSLGRKPESGRLRYIVFDLIALDGDDMRMTPFSVRRGRLESLAAFFSPPLLLAEQTPAQSGKRLLEAAAKAGLEGIMAKRLSSFYRGERSADWIKVKCRKRREFVIGGYTFETENKVKALLLGAFEDGDLVYVGRVGSGMNEKDRESLAIELKRRRSKISPFKEPPALPKKEKRVYVEPYFSAEVEFAEMTKDGLLRQASFKGLRTDKEAKQVTKREPTAEDTGEEEQTESGSKTVAGVAVSSPERAVFKNADKLALAKYYEAVAPLMLPYLKDRAVSVVRCHESAEGEKFFKKHPTAAAEKAVAVTVGGDGEEKTLLAAPTTADMIRQVQYGTVEFHIYGAKASSFGFADMLVFDFDPDGAVTLSRLKDGVRELYDLLGELGLRSYLKTSGGKGYHAVVPLSPAAPWDKATAFAKNTALCLEKRKRGFTSNIRISARKDKIFVDWQRNIKGATFVCPYSCRARAAATVSAPLFWEELKSVSPSGIDIFEALHRLDDDPWHDFFAVKQSIE